MIRDNLKKILLFVFIFNSVLLYAQKKQLAVARELLKSGKELAKAEKSMQTLLDFVMF